MKIRCSNCKAKIDTEKYDFCPRCGAGFSYKEAAAEEPEPEEAEKAAARARKKEAQKANREAELMEKRKRQSRDRNDGNTAVIALGGLAVIVFFVLNWISAFYGNDEPVKSDEERLEDYFGGTTYVTFVNPFETTPEETTEPPLPEVMYTAGLGEEAFTGEYGITCTGFRKEEHEALPPDEGMEYVSFGLSLKNYTDSTLSFDMAVSCYADGEKATAVFFLTDEPFRPDTLAKGKVYSGRVCYEVPENTESFELHCGGSEDITIKIKP
ncbi:MAG: DUF4352 domain-containing protein [Ruminiclostridium sp.]|nr:DUF4352 domain-containing protein [Ruminiclostridium sp.]